MSQSASEAGRRVVPTATTAYGTYHFDVEPNPDIGFLRLSYDRESGRGSYVLRMAPGARTEEHTHQSREEYLILEGTLREPDGTLLGPGDHVIYEPGTRHHSRTDDGCVLIAFHW